MPHAIRFHKTGGPEVLQWDEVPVGKPGPGEARLRPSAVGLNYVETYFRSGLYPTPPLPSGLGTEAAGIVEEVGPGVTDVKPGDRVAAAGGVGLIACQWAKSLGATVIGTVGSEEKAKLAKDHGCDYPILYTREDFVARVKDITKGEMVPVVYDSVGKDTFMKSLDALRPLGLMVNFGQSSGSVGPIDLGIFAQKGSLFYTRPTLNTYAAKRADYLAMTKDLFDVVQSGKVKIEVNQTYKLKDAAQAHRDLQSRKTTGSTVLTV